MTMWVMAASPLLTNNDVRVMSDDILEILTNPEVLAVHKDPLTKMASRIDVGGGVNEPHTASLDVTWSSYGKPLADGSTAVMVRENLRCCVRSWDMLRVDVCVCCFLMMRDA